MADPITIQFGPWSPDLQNVATQIPFAPKGIVQVPTADALNCYYQDGAYRSIPGPASIGPALGSRVLNAFTWYDTSTGNELVFSGSVDSLNELLSGAWSAVPIGGSPLAFKLTITQGTPTFINGLLNAQITVGNVTSGLTYHGFASGNVGSWTAGAIGSLSPVFDVFGHLVGVFGVSDFITPHGVAQTIYLIYQNASLGASYFTTVSSGVLTSNLTSASATYTTGSGFSQWVWSFAAGTGPWTGFSGTYSLTIS